MIKRIFLIIALSFTFQWVTAQIVSDEQVVRMIMTEKQRGADETSIARMLLQKGATPAQLRRIKEKYAQEQNGLGAVDLTGKETKTERLRGGKKTEGDFMLSKDDVPGGDELKKDVQKELSFLDLDSVVYYNNQLKELEKVSNDYVLLIEDIKKQIINVLNFDLGILDKTHLKELDSEFQLITSENMQLLKNKQSLTK